ncbi:MAG: class I SAM-dependent rRNA methyltransferase [Deltaproteobacteria bacterium]|nr:class I SAM-dependent rRNA methyltransferase [Deltaproteobacteria bacterium]
METAVLSRTSRIASGHLWVFSNEIEGTPLAFTPGAIVELRDKKGGYLGKGYVNPRSLIAVRILTREREEINRDFFLKRVKGALEYRRRFISGRDSFRAVYSEGDNLPGLIVDKYGDCLSVQFLTLGMEMMLETVLDVLDEVFSPSTIVLRNDTSIRALEGLALEKKVIKGSLDVLPRIHEGNAVFEVDPLLGQKTGFFLDQTENRDAFSALIGPGRGLDLFSYTGAWAIRMASSGASVTGVDSSEPAVAFAAKNAALNNMTGRCVFEKADIFEFVKDDISKGKRYDYISVDPPAFVKSKTKLREGLRAYREINASCMRLLDRRGMMVSSSCSFHVDRLTFLDTLRQAAKDAGKSFRTVEVRSQAKDHPISLHVPETEYLKCAILQALD